MVNTDRQAWRGVRVVSERGFMHKLRSAIDGHSKEDAYVYFDFVSAFDKRDFGVTPT